MLDFLLEVVLPSTEARDVLASFGRDHRVDLRDKSQTHPVWIIAVFGGRADLGQCNLDIKVDGGVAFNMDCFDLILLQNCTSATWGHHLEAATCFALVAKASFHGGLESSAVDVFSGA